MKTDPTLNSLHSALQISFAETHASVHITVGIVLKKTGWEKPKGKKLFGKEQGKRGGGVPTRVLWVWHLCGD